MTEFDLQDTGIQDCLEARWALLCSFSIVYYGSIVIPVVNFNYKTSCKATPGFNFRFHFSL